MNEENIEETELEHKCKLCGITMNFYFLLPNIKVSGLCPNCYYERNEK